MALFKGSTRVAQGARRKDPVAQAFEHVLGSQVFDGLLRDIAAQANPSDEVNTVVRAEMDEPELTFGRVTELGAVQDAVEAGIPLVVLDRTDDAEALTSHDPVLNIVVVGQVKEGEPGYDPATRHYWGCFYNLLYELCNASQAARSRAVFDEAEGGRLDCVSFALAMESIEDDTDVMFDRLWTEMSKDPPWVWTDGVLRRETPPDDLLITQGSVVEGRSPREARWHTQVNSGHVAAYVRMWGGGYASAYSSNNAQEWDTFRKVLAQKGELDEGSVVDAVRRLTGADVTSAQIKDVVTTCVAVWKDAAKPGRSRRGRA
ncbi:hypothetical protein [Acrocarpospora phusangensis]|nr:hypothetical protein [Acrocarpospora phusangensis]